MLPGDIAKLIEDAGLDAMAMGEHSHIPLQPRVRRHPGAGDLPAAYARTLDLFVTFSAAAAATTRLRFESSIIQVAQRGFISTAKAAASVDFLSGGRLDLIVGHGLEHPGDAQPRHRPRHPLRTRARAHARHVPVLPRATSPPTTASTSTSTPFGAGPSRRSPAASRSSWAATPQASSLSQGRFETGDGWAPIEGPGILERVAAFRPAPTRACRCTSPASRPTRDRSACYAEALAPRASSSDSASPSRARRSAWSKRCGEPSTTQPAEAASPAGVTRRAH